MTLEEVEIVFGTGAGQRVKAALGRSSAQSPHTPIHYKPDGEDEEDDGDKNMAAPRDLQPVAVLEH